MKKKTDPLSGMGRPTQQQFHDEMCCEPVGPGKPVVLSGPNHRIFLKDLAGKDIPFVLTVPEARKLAIDLLTVAGIVDETIEAERINAQNRCRLQVYPPPAPIDIDQPADHISGILRSELIERVRKDGEA